MSDGDGMPVRGVELCWGSLHDCCGMCWSSKEMEAFVWRLMGEFSANMWQSWRILVKYMHLCWRCLGSGEYVGLLVGVGCRL